MFEVHFPHKLQQLVVAALVIGCGFLLINIASVAKDKYQQSAARSNGPSTTFDSMDGTPNVVTQAFVSLGDLSAQVGNSLGRVTNATIEAAGEVSVSTAQSAGHGTMAVIRIAGLGLSKAGGGLMFTARILGETIFLPFRLVGSVTMFALHMPVKAFGALSDTPSVSALIMPASDVTMPHIDNPGVVLAAQTSIPAPSPEKTQWPIHGAITTLFGVPEYPYMAYHTGLDISDGQPAGVTPIHPFESGRVLEVIHSHVRLGNEVIIDHGGGVTSVYGHMYSTYVTPGQMVNENTVLGFEGSTGVSTGPHVHFEIHVNGVAVDPHRFISGQP